MTPPVRTLEGSKQKSFRGSTSLCPRGSNAPGFSKYHGLWVVEKAFRVSKGNLEMRPVFHFTERRIEAHVCICFIAYKVYKELERIIRISKINLSVDKVLDIAKTIATIDIKTDGVDGVSKRTLFLTEEQMAIKPLFDLRSLLSD